MKTTKFLLVITVFILLVLVGVILYQFVLLPLRNVQTVSDCAPINFKKELVDNSYYLKWKTKQECTGYVRYGSSQNTFPYLALDEQGVVKLKDHSVKLNGIVKGDRYYFVIISEEKSYGLEESSILLEF